MIKLQDDDSTIVRDGPTISAQKYGGTVTSQSKECPKSENSPWNFCKISWDDVRAEGLYCSFLCENQETFLLNKHLSCSPFCFLQTLVDVDNEWKLFLIIAMAILAVTMCRHPVESTANSKLLTVFFVLVFSLMPDPLLWKPVKTTKRLSLQF